MTGGTRAYGPVTRVGGSAAGIAHLGVGDAGGFPEQLLRAPKAAHTYPKLVHPSMCIMVRTWLAALRALPWATCARDHQ